MFIVMSTAQLYIFFSNIILLFLQLLKSNFAINVLYDSKTSYNCNNNYDKFYFDLLIFYPFLIITQK